MIMSQGLSFFFNVARWVAAWAVLAYHTRALLLVSYHTLKSKLLFFKAIYFLTGFGHQAVIIFFVISGYLVGGLTVLKSRRQAFDLGEFFVHRISRIYTVLLPALLMGGLLDHFGIRYFDESGIYAETTGKSIASLAFTVGQNLSLRALLGNIAMLETLDGRIVPVFGSNGPLWSLAYEWWYYCLFAAFMVVRTNRKPLARIIAGLAICLMLATLPAAMIAWSVMWLMGVGVCLLGSQGRAIRLPPWCGIGACLLTLAVSRVMELPPLIIADLRVEVFLSDFMVAVGFASALFAFHHPKIKVSEGNVSRKMADCSYSVYVFHFPALIFLVALINRFFGNDFLLDPSWMALIFMIAICATLLFYCWIMSLLTEAQTHRVRRAMSRVLPIQ